MTSTRRTKAISTIKMLSTSLLLTILSLSFVKSQHVSLPRTARDAECRTSDLRLIREYFETTSIIRNQYTTEPKYCSVTNQLREDSANVSHPYPKIDLDKVIDLYTTLDYVNSYKYIDYEGPVVRDGFLSINDDEMLPLYIMADIRRKHLRCHNSQTGFEEDVDDQMSLMGQRNTDGRGHLLAHSLGGTSRALNVIPMAVNIYLHPHFETNADLLEPLADWRSNEFWIRKFLKHFYPNGRVEWKMAVQYEENVFVGPKQAKSYRPLSFSLQYTAYTDQDDIHSVYYTSPNMTFLNDNHHTCKPRVSSYHNEDGGRAPPNCNIPMAAKTKTRIELKNSYDLRHRLGGLSWPRNALFSFRIKENTFLYDLAKEPATTPKYYWETIKISSDTAKYNSGHFKKYEYTFPFHVKGRQFMYGHCHEDKSWIIREILEANMGQQIGYGIWPESHLSCAPFAISGKQYFYSQWTNNSWFIRELLPDATMGEEKSSNTWPQMYPVVFAYVKNNKHMLYAHNPATRDWIVRELLRDGQMGLELNSNKWSMGYQVSLNIIFSQRRQFMYALSTVQPYNWFFRELQPNGKIGSVVHSGNEDGSYPLACVATICKEKGYENCTRYLIKLNSQFKCDSIHLTV